MDGVRLTGDRIIYSTALIPETPWGNCGNTIWGLTGSMETLNLSKSRKQSFQQSLFFLPPSPPLSVRVPGSNFWHTYVPNFYSGVVGKHTSYRYGNRLPERRD